METLFDFKKDVILHKLKSQWILIKNKKNAILTLKSEDYYFLKKIMGIENKNVQITYRGLSVWEWKKSETEEEKYYNFFNGL